MADLIAGTRVVEAGQTDLQGGAAEVTLPRVQMVMGVDVLVRPSVVVLLAEVAAQVVAATQVMVVVAAAQ